MTDDRPKPKYGELAPEGWSWTPPQPPTPDADDSAPGADPAGARPAAAGPAFGQGSSAAEQKDRASWPAPTAGSGAPPVPGAPAPAGAQPARRSGDIVVTIALLALGLFSTVNSVISLLSLRGLMQEFMDVYGISGSYTAETGVVGPTGAVLLIAVFALTALVAVRRMRAGKLAFFVPLIGAAISFIVLFVCLTIALVADPTILDAVQSGTL